MFTGMRASYCVLNARPYGYERRTPAKARHIIIGLVYRPSIDVPSAMRLEASLRSSLFHIGLILYIK